MLDVLRISELLSPGIAQQWCFIFFGRLALGRAQELTSTLAWVYPASSRDFKTQIVRRMALCL